MKPNALLINTARGGLVVRPRLLPFQNRLPVSMYYRPSRPAPDNPYCMRQISALVPQCVGG